jgi:glutathione peroxidase
LKHLVLKIIAFGLYISLSFLKGQTNSIYQYNANDIDGIPVKMDSFKGKKLLIVNTASRCGLTPQLKELEQLYKNYGDSGLVIIGFPSNDFGNEEPRSNSEIKSFCERNYGVSFLMMEKIHVKGDSIHPIYQWLTKKSKNGVKNSGVKWNFQKYMIDEQGRFAGMVNPWKRPDCGKITKWLNKP